MRLLEYFHDYTLQANPNSFRPKSTWTPPPHREIALDTFLHAVEHDVRNIKPEPVSDNLTSRERHALKSLDKRNDIVIKSADKGTATEVMDRDWYINDCLRQLNDTKYYRLLDNDITDDIQKRVEVYVEGMLRDKSLTTTLNISSYSLTPNLDVSTFYLKYIRRVILAAPLFLATVIPLNVVHNL